MLKYMCEELYSFLFFWNECDDLFHLLFWIFMKDLTLQAANGSRFLALCEDKTSAELYPVDLLQKGSSSSSNLQAKICDFYFP